jgi:hypothetical protein
MTQPTIGSADRPPARRRAIRTLSAVLGLTTLTLALLAALRLDDWRWASTTNDQQH